MGPAQQSRDTVHELGHQARVRVVGLAVVVGHDLWGKHSHEHHRPPSTRPLHNPVFPPATVTKHTASIRQH